MLKVRTLLALSTLTLTLTAATPARGGKDLEKRLHGRWRLAKLTCNGVGQELPLQYVMTFEGSKGEYISTGIQPACTQRELEHYTYLSSTQVAIKQGNRICQPNPCAADLPATECGKETNPKLPVFDIAFPQEGKTMQLSTSDPNSIDCTGVGQAKPAVFTFDRI